MAGVFTSHLVEVIEDYNTFCFMKLYETLCILEIKINVENNFYSRGLLVCGISRLATNPFDFMTLVAWQKLALPHQMVFKLHLR